MKLTRTTIAVGGVIAVPGDYLHALGIHEGDEIVVILDDEEIRVMPVRQALRKAQEIVREYVSDDKLLADELIAERREEAARE